MGKAVTPITIHLPLPPSANARHGVMGGRILLTKEARQWKEAARWHVFLQVKAKKLTGLPLKGRVRTTVVIHPRSKKNGEGSKVMLDRDNACKAPLDALNGIVYEDDSQIAPLTVWPTGKPKPGGGITIIVYIPNARAPAKTKTAKPAQRR